MTFYNQILLKLGMQVHFSVKIRIKAKWLRNGAMGSKNLFKIARANNILQHNIEDFHTEIIQMLITMFPKNHKKLLHSE